MKKNERLEKTIDFFNGILVLWKGWEHLDHYHRFPIRILFLFLAGAAIIVGTFFSGRIERKVKNFSAFFHFFESITLFICGSLFLEEGKSRLPVLYFFLALVALSIGLTKLLARGQDREAALLRLRLVLGITFIVFAAAMTVVMLLVPFYRHPFMAAALAITTGMGIYNLVAAKKRLAESK